MYAIQSLPLGHVCSSRLATAWKVLLRRQGKSCFQDTVPIPILLVKVDHERHSSFIMPLGVASKLKALTCSRWGKGVIKHPGLTRGNTVVHEKRCVVHLIHRHMLHIHPHWFHHELVSHLSRISDNEVIGHSGRKVVREESTLVSESVT